MFETYQAVLIIYVGHVFGRKYTLKSFAPIELHTNVAAHVAKSHETVMVHSLEVYYFPSLKR